MDTQQFIKALVVWFIGLPISIGISLFLRKFLGVDGLGMPEIVWFTMHIILFLSSLLFFYKSIQPTSVMKKMLITSMYVFVGGIYYILLTWFYVIELGIDSV